MTEENVEVKAKVLVRCPRVEFRMTRAEGCMGCPSFAGLGDRFPDAPPSMPFAKRYLLLCNDDPVKRELIELCEGEG